MIASKAANPNCMYLWMNYIISPEANAKVAEYFGEAPVEGEGVRDDDGLDHCANYHAADEATSANVYYWNTPQADCGDDRGDVCKDYEEWTIGLDGDPGLVELGAERVSAPTSDRRCRRRRPRRGPGAAALHASSSAIRALGCGRCCCCRSDGSWSATWARSLHARLARSGTRDPFTAEVVHESTLDNYRTLLSEPVYRTITIPDGHDGRCRHGRLRGAGVPDRLLHGPHRVTADAHILVVAVLDPLWASYLVKVYTWRTILGRERRAQLAARAVRPPWPRLLARGHLDRLHVLWLPYMILPVYAGLERIPPSLLEASADLGARSGRTFCPGRPATGLPGDRRRLDLHVRAHARRLHNCPRSSRASSSSATSSTTTSASRTTSRSPPRTRWCRSPSWSATSGSPSAWGRSRISDGRRARNTLAPADRDGAASSAFIYFPLVIVALYAFNANITQSWPIRTGRPSGSPSPPRRRRTSAFFLSVKAALLATAVALVLGTLLAFAMSRFDFFGRNACRSSSCSRSRCRESSPGSP